MTGGSAKRIAWGDRGKAGMLALAYGQLGSKQTVQIWQAAPIARDQPFELRIGGHTELVCWGVMPSGMLRHPFFSRWSGDRSRPPRA